MKFLERCIRQWAKVTDGFVNDWNIGHWVAELESSHHDEHRIAIAIKYLVSTNVKPNLDALNKVLKHNLDKWYIEHEQMKEIADDGIIYARMCVEAMSRYNHWEELKKVVEWGMEKAPKIDWSEALAEIEENIRLNRDSEMPSGGSQEPVEEIS